MGLWSAYFFAKLLLFAGGYIDFSPWWNLAFAAFAALPPKNGRQRFAKNLIAVPLSIVLLYHDSWLPPISRALSQAGNLQSFSGAYLLELLGRFISLKVMAELAVMMAVYLVARRKLRLSTFVFIAIVLIGFFPHGWPSVAPTVVSTAAAGPAPALTAAAPVDPRNMRPEALDALLGQFYAKEKQRQVRFTPAAEDAAPYDILVLNVCSLAWDDLKFVKRDKDPLFARFDLVLSNFSSGASYSGPAAIRLLRGACGQAEHMALYNPPNPECLVLDGLQKAGFEPHWLMNHDGQFGNFYADVRDRGGVSVTPDSNAGAQLAQQAFDGSPIYDDYSVLSRWWAKREQNPARHVVLYYNTVTLHDGNKVVAAGGGHGDSSYAARVNTFIAAIGHFLDDLQHSGRHVVVVLLPEHGAALRGDRRQISGLREIPTPAISNVPVGVLLVNAVRDPQWAQQRIDTPSSFLAVNELLSRLVADNPFAKQSVSIGGYTQNLPETDSVAENEGTTVMLVGRQYMMRTPDGTWSPWDTSDNQ
jgi:cellulose synthase operon protein YhjU